MNISRGLSAGGALGAMLLVVACAEHPGLKPQASVADADRLAVSQSLVGAGIEAGAWPAQNWWTRFGDSQLDQLMAEGLAGSPNLRVALARARQASALAAAAASARSPRVDSSLSATRERFPANALIPPPVGGTWGTFDQLQASLSWDVDLWGKNRAAYEAAVGQARATAVDAQAARLALSSTSHMPTAAAACPPSTGCGAGHRRSARTDLRADGRPKCRWHRLAARSQAGRIRVARGARADRAAR